VLKILPWLLAVALAGFAGFLLASRCAPTPNVEQLELLFETVSPAVVTVRTDLASLDDVQAKGFGTAFHIGDGVFVTAAHVIDGGSRFYIDARVRTVSQLEGTQSATLIGMVPEFDLAVLKSAAVPAKLEWASQAPRIGARAVAIGNPFARAPRSLTVGVISGLNRVVSTESRSVANLVQFDAQVNPGNSGGPLLDANGRVIGLISSILSPTGSSAGVGFAVSANVLREAVAGLLRGEKTERPTLGAIGKSEGKPQIRAVIPGSVAERAGLRTGDEVLEVNGTPLETLPELNAIVASSAAGAKLEIKLKRGSGIQTLTATLETP
jgi:2-alkenal reductase